MRFFLRFQPSRRPGRDYSHESCGLKTRGRRLVATNMRVKPGGARHRANAAMLSKYAKVYDPHARGTRRVRSSLAQARPKRSGAQSGPAPSRLSTNGCTPSSRSGIPHVERNGPPLDIHVFGGTSNLVLVARPETRHQARRGRYAAMPLLDREGRRPAPGLLKPGRSILPPVFF